MSRAKPTGTCNRFPRVWAAIFGCEGVGRHVGWTAPTTMHGRHTPVYACKACSAAYNAGRALRCLAHQSFLTQAQWLAGVVDYRYQGTGRDPKSKRPFLINRRTGMSWTMMPITQRWTDWTPHEGRDW